MLSCWFDEHNIILNTYASVEWSAREACGVLHTSTHCDGCVTNGLACNNAGIACTQCKWKWARKRNKNSKNGAEKNRTGAIYYFGSFAVCIFAELHAKMLTK